MTETNREGENPENWRLLAEWTVASERGNERQVMERVGEVAQGQPIPKRRLEQLKTAVAEATMNAMEHGNKYNLALPVSIQVLASHHELAVRIRDQGSGKPIPETETPDLEAKLAELQTPRGWGLFLIKNLVDDMRIMRDDTHHTVELIMHLEGD